MNLPEIIVNPTYPTYPPYHKGDYIEEYFYRYQQRTKINTKRTYIPLSWTTLVDHTRGGYDVVRQYVSKNLNDTEHYYAVIMGDYVPHDIPMPKNIKIFHAAGYNKIKDVIQIPVCCTPFNSTKNTNISTKSLFASFVGSETHEYRRRLIEHIKDDKRIFSKIKHWSVVVSPTDLHTYKSISQRSKFVFCPRGNAPTSYRIYESMQVCSVPIIYSDTRYFPMEDILDWDKLCLYCDDKNIKEVIEFAFNMTDKEWTDRVEYGWEMYHTYFTQEKVCDYIKNILEKELI